MSTLREKHLAIRANPASSWSHSAACGSFKYTHSSHSLTRHNQIKGPIDIPLVFGFGGTQNERIRQPNRRTCWQSCRHGRSELLVVASPELLNHGPPLHKPADCLSYPLLHRSDRRCCIITASRRARATIAFFIPRCLAIFIAGLEPGPFYRMGQHGLGRLAEHRPHHLVSASRYRTASVDFARLILRRGQSKHRTDRLRFAEAGGRSTVAR
jgi:hypothetical protein